MLYNLRRQRFKNPKNKIFGFNKLNSIAPGGFPDFDPTNLPNFLAGYYSNLLTDTPAGTIQGGSSGAWYDINNIPNAPKRLNRQAGWNGAGSNGLINGLKCWRLGFVSPTSALYMSANSNDILNGLTDFTIISVIHRESVSTNQSIFFTHMLTGSTHQFYLAKRINRELQIDMTNLSTMQGINLITTAQFNDNETQIVIGQFDQTNKTARIIVNGVENLSGSNVLYTGATLNTNLDTPRIGNYTSSTTSFRFSGLVGDIYFFSSIISNSIINSMGNYLAAKFAGTWSNI